MKKIAMLLLTMSVTLGAMPAIAASWVIDQDGDDVRMRPKNDYDYSRRYKGSIDDDGDVRLRNPYTADRLRGNIDEDGYGRLRDSDGNTYRVKPRW